MQIILKPRLSGSFEINFAIQRYTRFYMGRNFIEVVVKFIKRNAFRSKNRSKWGTSSALLRMNFTKFDDDKEQPLKLFTKISFSVMNYLQATG